MEKQEILKKIHEEELKLLKKCIDVCEKNNIPYFALGGTLLGAVRHKGFIPWDDDIDLGIPRSSYRQLIELLNDDNVVIEKNVINLNVLQYKKKDKVIIGNKSYEIYIDLFPLDGTPNNKLLRNIFLSKFVFYRTLYKLSIVNQLNIVDRGFVGNSIVWLMKMIGISKLLPTEQIVEKIHSIAETYDFESSTYVGNILGRYHKKEIVDKTIFGSGIKLDFEELQLNCPEVFDSYLKHIYGDYMKLPKEEDRVAHFEELNVQG